MKYLIVFVLFMSSCKNNKQEFKPKLTNLTEKKVALSSKIKILVCKGSKRDVKLYKEFIKSKKIVYKTNMDDNNLYYSAQKESFDLLFSSENINCIVPLLGSGYNIFDIYYNTILAENIFNNIIMLNKNKENEWNNYHDFFKRGMVFMLNKEANKITVLTFNPFVNNKKPKEVKAIVSNSKLKFDKVIMIIGIGHIETLVN